MHQTVPAVWLRAEIDRSIDAARGCLARSLVHRGERTALLRDARTHVRQVRGALDMLALEGASCFCRALEAALAAFETTQASLTELDASVVDRALFALKQFLADIAQGEPDRPLKLFPVYKELNTICGREAASAVDLFHPDLDARPPLPMHTPRVHPATLAAHVSACGSLFQRGLVSWFRDETRLEGIGMMRSALDGLQRTAGEFDVHPALWWVAAGLTDVLAHADERVDTAAARLTLARLERALHALAAGGDIASTDLVREVLYPIALARPVTERVREIKAHYRLDNHIPEYCVSGTLEHDTQTLAPLLDAMRETLERIEQAWSRYAAGAPASLLALREETIAFRDAARDLGHYRLVRLIDIVLMIVAKLPQAGLKNEGLSLEMAAVLLFMEGMLEHFTNPPPDMDQQVAVMAGWLLDAVKQNPAHRAPPGTPRDDITQRRQVADIRRQVIAEIQENLLRVEELVEEAARRPQGRNRLADAERPLAQAAGALEMLGLNRASGVLAACRQLLRACAADPGSARLGTLQWAADGLSCLGFYLDAQRRGAAPDDEVLADFVRRLANDREPPAGSTGWIPASVVSMPPMPDADEAPDANGIEAPICPIEVTTASSAGVARDRSRAHGAQTSPLPPAHVAPPAAPPTASALPVPQEASEPAPALALDEPDASLLPAFLEEAQGLLGRLYNEFVAWRAAPIDIRTARAFARTLHTLKGSARLVGAMRLGDYAHGVESYVGTAIETAERADATVDFAPLQHMLTTIAEQVGTLAGRHDRGRAAAEAVQPTSAHAGVPSPEALDAPTPVRIPLSALNGFIATAGELSEVRARTEDEMGTLRRSLHELAQTLAQLRTGLDQATNAPHASSAEEHGLRMQALNRAMGKRLDEVHAVQRALVVSCADTEVALALQGRLDRSLRHKLLELRSLPFGSLAQRLRRTVRQTALQLAREAELHIEGDTVAIDRAVLQRLAAPLEHMLRNAVAHGIEPVAARIAAGKAPVGSIRLLVEQSEDEHVLTLSDDGVGLAIEQIRAQAVQRGLVGAGQTLTPHVLCSLIFAPGLSTAATVTAACGRGIGLDVVRAEVRALGGSIEVKSEPGAGTCFRIRIPSSLSYSQALLVRASGRVYAIPATLVEQVCELPAESLSAARENGRIDRHEQEYRFADLTRLLDERSPLPDLHRSNSVLLLHGDGERVALHVEQLLRKQAIERKNIGPQLARVRGIAGATIMGKGEVVLILDPFAAIRARPAARSDSAER